jgi:membrane fusion protein (multidrug efflux system)
MMAVLAGCSNGEAQQTPAQASPPAQVTVTQVARQTVTLERVYPGRAQAADDVDVRARVQGILLERRYEEGTRVKAGSVLFRIEPAPYQARVQQAQAELQRANAQLRQAQREWQRVSALFKENAVSARQRDEAQSTLDLAQASVANAEAVLRTARIDLDYTEVRAPISGVTGLRAVSQGNLVNPGDMLTTIHQLDPVHVLFSLPEADAIAQRRQFGLTGAAPAANRRPVAHALLPDGNVHEREGAIDFIAASVDPQTGTVQARGVFPNPQGVLVPGQFLRISVGGVQLPDTIVVPARAVAQGPQGPVVYVVDEQNLAQARPVTLGQTVEQGRVITGGLQEGEKVVVDGIIGVQSGKPVQPIAADGAASRPAGAAR